MGTIIRIMIILPAAAAAVLFVPFFRDTVRYPDPGGEIIVKYIKMSPVRRLADGGNAWILAVFFILAAAVIITSFMRKNMKCPVWINRTLFVLFILSFITALILSASQSLKY